MPSVASIVTRLRLWVRFFARIHYPRDVRLVRESFQHRRAFTLPPETWALVESMGGFLSDKEAGILHWAATSWPVAGPVLELGSYEGRSTVVFAKAGRQVHAVDAWSLAVSDLSAYGSGDIPADSVFDRFQENIQRAQATSRVHIHRGLSHEVGQHWHVPGAILFIDAGHIYADVKGDLDVWTPHLLPDGLLLMHDVLGDVYLDVTRAASELLLQGWRVVASAGSIVAFCRE